MSITGYLMNPEARRDIRQIIHASYDLGMTQKKTIANGALIYGAVRGGWRCVEIAERCGKEFAFYPAYYKKNGEKFTVCDLGSGVNNLRIATGQWNIDLSEIEPKDGLIMLGDLVMMQADSAAEELPEMVRLVLLASRAIANSAPREEQAGAFIAPSA